MKPVSEPAYTLPLMMIFLLMGLYSTTSNDTLLEVCGLSVCKKHDADFARQKLWGKIFLLTILKGFFIRVLNS